MMVGHARSRLASDFFGDRPNWSFTRTAERLGLRQSTVSQHIRKLEEETRRRLFVRDTHSVTTTADGEAMIQFARGILAANERAERYFAGSQLRGRLRFGASEDFAASLLPEVLREFVRTHPLVEFELTVGLSGELTEKLERGELDLAAANVVVAMIADAFSGAIG